MPDHSATATDPGLADVADELAVSGLALADGEQIFSSGTAATGGHEPAAAAAAPLAAENQALLARLREVLLATAPSIDPGLVHGETLAEVEASFAAARETVARVREAVRREEAAAIPAGAPGRAVLAPSSPFEKIRAGLGRLA